ncbi:MAG TPA: hypothetical protein VEB42_06490 [Chitinophagaceae bacterium]|nr:hypothetical protein [Chitinophagaceae bacterium]
MKKILYFFAIAAILSACSKPVTPADQSPPPPRGSAVATEIGQPTGNAISKAIGSNGGSIASADGKVTVNIPAGALESNQTISLQPIESKAPLGMQGFAYRLQPQGLELKKPATVSLKYIDKDVTGTLPELVSLAAQQQNQTWKKVSGASLDKNTKTITAPVSRLADYSFYTAFVLRDNKTKTDTAIVHAVTTEEIKFYALWENDLGDGLVAAAPAPYTKEWMLNSVVNPPLENKFGYLGGKNGYYPSEVDYFAPRRAPDSDTVAISVKLDLGSKGIMYLVRTIVIDDANKLIINGKLYSDAIPVGIIYEPTGLLSFGSTQQMPNGKIVSATLTISEIFNATPGTYHFSGSKNVQITAQDELGHEWASEKTLYNGTKAYTGEAEVTVSGVAPNRFITGKITGNLFGKGNTQGDAPVEVTFAFNAH